MPPIEAVIFDWGGTLSHWIAQERVPEFWRIAAQHLDATAADTLADRLLEAESVVWAEVRGAQRSGRIDEIMRAALALHELEVADELFAGATSVYLDAWERELRHKADALPTLAALKSLGLKTALLSNTHWPREFHETLLRRDGLTEFIDARLYTSEMTHVKPHPIVFKQVLKAVDARAERTVFVGDRRYDDMYGAQALGMRTVLVLPSPENDDYDVTPDATITELSELVGILDGWLNLGSV